MVLNGLYQISDLGRVKSLSREFYIIDNKNKRKYLYKTKERILKPFLHGKNNRNHVMAVQGRKNGKNINIYIAREVAKNFLKADLCSNDIVMYKDGNINNCRLENLYIISKAELTEKKFKEGKLKRRVFDYYGEKITIKDAVRKSGKKQDTIKSRLSYNWNIYETIEVPVSKKKGVNY